jgi:CxxC motif-containing protein (DUF1111 family)
MKSSCSRPVYLSIVFFVLASAVFVNAPKLYSQGGPGQIFDHGPRPSGTQPFNANCPLPAGTQVKFGFPGLNCNDLDQPQSNPPNPAADGAGNFIGQAQGNFGQLLVPMWFQGISIFETVASVIGGPNSTTNVEPLPGLGPSFNSQSCFQCHSQPAVGGSSPGIININTAPGVTTQFISFQGTPFQFTENPEIIAAHDRNATNVIPSFLPIDVVSGPGFPTVPTDGPVIEVRFVNGLAANGNAAAVAVGGVGELFTIQGRTDEPAGCNISQLNFTNTPIAFRIPTPTYGLGLVENTPDLTLIKNLAAEQPNNFGVLGRFNISGNDGTITRFGWKAQNKSLLIFAGEASNVEMGVTNELFPDEKTWGNGLPCISNLPPGYPEDQILTTGTGNPPDPSVISSVAQNNAVFMRMNGAPSQCDSLLSGVNGNGVATCQPFGGPGSQIGSPQVIAGQVAFTTVGCSLCHSITLTTAPSVNSSLSNQPYHPYSDFALHHMGSNDADGINQGIATSDEFRTAPLWGLGQRYFFFHDGRASNLVDAIADHCPVISTNNAGEACKSVAAFNALSPTAQQDILDFLRSL